MSAQSNVVRDAASNAPELVQFVAVAGRTNSLAEIVNLSPDVPIIG